MKIIFTYFFYIFSIIYCSDNQNVLEILWSMQRYKLLLWSHSLFCLKNSLNISDKIYEILSNMDNEELRNYIKNEIVFFPEYLDPILFDQLSYDLHINEFLDKNDKFYGQLNYENNIIQNINQDLKIILETLNSADLFKIINKIDKHIKNNKTYLT